MTHVPLAAFCLPSQPRQGHETEQGTAIPAVLSPSKGAALQAPTPLPSRSRDCIEPLRAPAFPTAPCRTLHSVAPKRAGSSVLIRSKKQSHQSGWAGAIAETSLGSFIMEQLCLPCKLLVLPAQLSASQLSAFQGPAHQKGVDSCPSHSFVEGFVLGERPMASTNKLDLISSEASSAEAAAGCIC